MIDRIPYIIACVGCGRDRPHHAMGRCVECFREHMADLRRIADGPCNKCNRWRKLENGMCRQCARIKTKGKRR